MLSYKYLFHKMSTMKMPNSTAFYLSLSTNISIMISMCAPSVSIPLLHTKLDKQFTYIVSCIHKIPLKQSICPVPCIHKIPLKQSIYKQFGLQIINPFYPFLLFSLWYSLYFLPNYSYRIWEITLIMLCNIQIFANMLVQQTQNSDCYCCSITSRFFYDYYCKLVKL